MINEHKFPFYLVGSTLFQKADQRREIKLVDGVPRASMQRLRRQSPAHNEL